MANKDRNIELIVSTRYDGRGVDQAMRDIDRINTKGSATRNEAASFARGTRRAENAVYARNMGLSAQIGREAATFGRSKYGGGFNARSANLGGGGAMGSGAGGRDELYQGLKSVGVFAMASKLAGAMGQAVETMDAWRQNVKLTGDKFGATRLALEDSIPVIGGFMKAGRSIREAIESMLPSGQRKRREQEEKDRKAEMAQMQGERDAKRAAVMGEGANALRESNLGVASLGLTGNTKGIADARTAYQEQMRLIGLDEQKKGGLSGDQQTQYMKGINQRKANALAEYNQKLADMQRAEQEEEQRKDREHKEAMLEAGERYAVEDLENQGMHLTARLKAIDVAAEKEKRAAQEKYVEEAKAAVELGGDYNSKIEAAAKRRDETFAAIERGRMGQRGGALGFGNQDRLRALEGGLDERMAAFGKESLKVEAEKRTIENERLKTIKEIEDQERAGAVNKAQSLALQAKANNLAKAQVKEVEKLARYAKDDRTYGVFGTLFGIRQDEMRKQAARTGNVGLGQQAEREAIVEEYRQRAVQLQRIIEDEKNSPEQRDAARALLGSIVGNAERAMKDVGRSKFTTGDLLGSFYAPGQEAGNLTGYGLAAKEALFANGMQSDPAQKTADNTGSILDQLGKIVAALGGGGTAQPIR